MASDVTGVGTSRNGMAGAAYGGDKGIFAFGTTGYASETGISNLVSNSGVVASDTSGVGTARRALGACEYGTQTAIFAYGQTEAASPYEHSKSNLVNSSGVIASDVTGVGTARFDVKAGSYGGDKGIFACGTNRYGHMRDYTNLVSNSGVIASDVDAVGTSVKGGALTQYGSGTAIKAFGKDGSSTNIGISHLISDSGTVGADVSAVGTGKQDLAAASFYA